MVSVNGVELQSMTYNSVSVQSWIHNGIEVFSSGVEITYIVRGVKYVEKVKKGASILSPTTFTPILSGATFKGWSSSAGSTTVLTTATATSAITLYAVFTYNTVTFSGTAGGGSSPAYSFYADYSKYYKINLSMSQLNGMAGVDLRLSDNYQYIVRLSNHSNPSTELDGLYDRITAISYDVDSWTTQTLYFVVWSNQNSVYLTGTMTMYGRTVVG